ncbi:MAG: YD repeat protein, partial [Parcubacteria group bacterium GW2011_GWE1_43_8]
MRRLKYISPLPLFGQGLHLDQGGGRTLVKLTVIMLTFLFIIGPVWPALAQEVEESNIQIDQGIVVPTEPSAESIEVPVDEPVDLPLTIINEAEKDKNNPKDDKNSDMLETTALMSSSFIGEEVANLQNSIQKSGPKLPEADQSTGALVYKYPLALPDGRNGLQPSIELTYNNQSVEEGSLFGYGWSISIPYIQRLNKHGAEQMYSRNDFTSSLSGELVDLGSGSFSAKVDGGEFMTYTLSSNTWAVKDKKGTMYRFGSTAQGRQDNPADASKIYKWMLEEVRDTNDNFIRYEYFKDQGQIYPSRIIYTGNGTADGPFNIEFSRELRTDLYTNYAGTFAATLRYRINLIQVYQLGLLIRNHQLLYSTGSNGYRSLLASITETGYSESGLSVTKPPVIFAYSQSTPGWAQQQNWSMSYPYANLLRIGNANNDGYLDLLEYHIIEHNPGEPENSIRITDTNNTRTAWWYTGVPPYPPMPFTDRVKGTCGGTGSSDGGTIVDDFNGDYLADMTKAFEYQQYYGYGDWIQVRDAWVNVAGQDWAQTPQWQLSMNIQRRCYPNYSGTTADFNGDGLVDIVGYETYANREVQINNGNGFNTPDPSWISQLGPGPGDRMEELFGRTVDINRDGLADNLQTFVNGQFQEEKHAFMNLGTGSWTDQNNWRLPMMLYMNFDNGYDNGVKCVDINADGLLDLFMLGTERFGGTTKYAYLNTGNGWQQRTDWNLYNPEGNLNAQTHMFDVNADGLVDIAKLEGNVQTYLKTGEVADLLERVTYPEGGNSEVIYKASTQYRLNPNDWNILNPNLPFIVQTVSQIVNNDGFGGNATTTYIYEGGDYYYGSPFDRKFAGFGKITKTDAVGNKAITYFHQGNESNSAQGEFNDHFSKIGRPYRVEQRDSADNLYNVAISKWENVDLGSGRHFVKNTQSVQMAYDGNSTHRDTAASSTYNNTNGNLTQNISWGEVVGSDDGTFTDTGTDKITTDYTYATGGSWGVTGLPATELTTDQSAAKVKESRYYYDLLALGSVGKGNLTKQEAWVIGSTYIDTENTYNSYGLVTQTLDGRNKPTSYIYDSYNLYPVTVTNALNQQTQYLYDYSLGKPKQVTDANGAISKTIYDGLDRVVEQKQSDRLTPATLVTSATYVYTYLPVGLQTQETKYLDSTTSVEAYSYTDGLGRAIQSRVEAETPGQFTVSDIVYNSRGLKQKESLPYFSSGSGRTAATSEANLYNTYVYDSAGRVIATTNAVGTVTTTYDDWKTTVTDARGNPKHAYVDAYGRLVKVEEVNGGTYATMYDYNGQGLLIKITDAAGNIRNFTYDGLGRRLTAQDLHAPADATFGTWAYTYDAAGNLLTKLDPKNQNIVYSYDDLNRQLTEDFTGQTGVEVIYAYDNCPRGQGRLCSVTSSALTETREYDALGSTSLEQKTINSTLYTTSYSYDRQGNQVLLTNPDGSQV